MVSCAVELPKAPSRVAGTLGQLWELAAPAQPSELFAPAIQQNKLVTLLELLRVYAQNYVRLIHCATLVAAALATDDPAGHGNDLVIAALGQMDGIRPQIEEMGLKLSLQQIDRITSTWDSYHDKKVFYEQSDELMRRLADEFRERVVLSIPFTVQGLFEQPRKDWVECIKRFPQITDNVDEMNRCFALSRYPAAVFHSLLVAEDGIIELGRYIGVTDLKPGWDATYRRLVALAKAGHAAVPAGVSFAFVEQILQCVESMKMAWRNKVNHVAGRLVVLDPQFTPQIAEEILIATRSFMRRLSVDI